MAISWQSRISELLSSGAGAECRAGFRRQNETPEKCPLFSGSSNSLFWPFCTPTISWKHAVFSFLTDFKPHLLMCNPGASPQGELSLLNYRIFQSLLQLAFSQLPTETARETGRYFIIPWHSIFLHHWQDHHPAKVHFQLSCLRRMKNYSSKKSKQGKRKKDK